MLTYEASIGERKKAKIVNDNGRLELWTMRNGLQWTGQPIDEDMIHLLKNVIEAYENTKE